MSRDASLQKYRDFYENSKTVHGVADECFEELSAVLKRYQISPNNTDPAEDLVDAIVKYMVASSESLQNTMKFYTK